ncbi:MAG: xanthine dehydrogenase small subunit [Ignavibacteriae bacterium]|nr:xanthine dehydrogenase small subunit [Ignavibacteriota bacterium]
MNNIIKFLLDDNVVEIDFSKEKNLKPTTTVLNYLRSLSNHKGVKEGCAEGDCGACTVVLAERGPDRKLKYKAVDSCLIFLPMIHGKQLITVENLVQRKDGKVILHPVQEMMVNSFGSQCGYCTPGFIMSLFALYKNHNKPSREIIEDSLSGNLCRCTGYQSILEAAFDACNKNGIDHFSEKAEMTSKILKEIGKDKTVIKIDTEKQSYFRPFTLDDALMLRKHYRNAIVINGASDVALKQTKKNELLSEIIDLSGVDELRIYDEENDGFYFGAGMCLEEKTLCAKKYPALYNILKVFGSLQIRNLATIGGNVGSASPIGDTLPVLIAYKSKIILQSSKSERELDIEDFIKGYRKTDLKSDELITSVFIPKLGKDVIIKSFKVSKRKDLDISTVSLASRLVLEKGKVKEIILAFGGMAETPKRAGITEELLKGKEWNRKNVESAMKVLYIEFNPISDARASAEFRRVTAKNLLMKLYLETIK